MESPVNPGRFTELLTHYIGLDWVEQLSAARTALGSPESIDPSLAKLFVDESPEDGEDWDEPKATKQSENGDGKDFSDSTGAENPQPSVANGQDQPRSARDVTATETPHRPKPRSNRIRLRVRRKTGRKRPQGVAAHRRITDEERSESLCEAFERSRGQDRFPVRVGHIQGYSGPRCDILSFQCEDEFVKFRDTGDIGLVQRFVEVKGRSAEDARIDLRGNELDAAQCHGERYWLYRLYEGPDGTIDLLTVRDPLEDESATSWLVEVDPSRAIDAQQFVLVEQSEDPD